MAIFSGKIHDAYYFSEDYKTIKIEVEDKERGVIFPHFIDVNPDDGEYKALLAEGYNKQKLVERTAAFKKDASSQFGKMVNDAAAQLAKTWADEWAPRMAKDQIDSHWDSELKHQWNVKQTEIENIREEYKYKLEHQTNLYNDKIEHQTNLFNDKVKQHHAKEEQLQAEYNTKLVELELKYNDGLRQQHEEYSRQLLDTASEKAKEMLGMTTIQEEKERLLREKFELENRRDKLKVREKELETSIEDKVKEIEDKEEHLVGLDQTVKIQTNKVESIIFDFMYGNNGDKDELFKFKLWALELEEIKKAPKEVKSAIRKAKKITAGVAIIDEYLND